MYLVKYLFLIFLFISDYIEIIAFHNHHVRSVQKNTGILISIADGTKDTISSVRRYKRKIKLCFTLML